MRDMTCDFCVGWTPGQWELFAKKRTYKERKRSLPSGSVSPATGATPCAGTSSEIPQPGTSSSSFSRPSGGQDKRGGALWVHLVLCPERLPPLPLDLGLARGEGVSLDIRPLGASMLLSLQPLRELGRGRLLGRDGLTLPAPLPLLLLTTHHSTLRDVMSREKFRRTAPLLDPPVFPDLRIEEQGRIVELALGRTALVTVAGVLALAPLAVRGQAVDSVGGCHPLGRDLRIAPALGACALVLRETGRSLLTATDHVVSVRVPLLAGRLAVT